MATNFIPITGTNYSGTNTPQGPSGAVQYNNGGSFAGVAGVSADGLGNLSVTGNVTAANLTSLSGSVSLTAVAANVGATNIVASASAGRYRLSYYVVCTTSGAGDSVPTLTFTFTDETQAQTLSASMPASSTAKLFTSGSFVLSSAAAQAIKYTIAAGVYTNGSKYSIYIVVEAI